MLRTTFAAALLLLGSLLMLLSAIGLILILKQIPHLLGHDDNPEGNLSFLQPDQETTP